MLTNREEYIKTFFIPLIKKEGIIYISNEDAEEIVKKISDIGNRIGFIGTNISQDKNKSEKRKHKYDVWIAKEVKKDLTLLDRSIDLRLIIDWAVENKIDLFSYSFEDAYTEQMNWHINLMVSHGVEEIKIPEIDKERIVFRFSDKNHFLYLLNEKDLEYEGKKMGHCVGGQNYKSNMKNGSSLILSLRDQNNDPHVTIEIQTSSSMVVQQQGKGNKKPINKYLQLLKEFIMYASNFPGLENEDVDVLKILNPHLLA
jgi:hypothetical protein